MKDRISLFNHFGAAQVETRILGNIQDTYKVDAPPGSDEDRVIRAAIRHVFNVLMIENKFRSYENTAARNKDIADLTVQKIGFRYALANQYIADFFPKNHPGDYKGLIAAVICDDFVHGLKGVNETISNNAARYWEEAYRLMETSPDDPIPPAPSTEATFLAHINAFQMISAMQSLQLNEYDEASLESLLKTQLGPMRSYIHLNTKMGNDLSQEIITAEDEIKLCLEDMRRNDTAATTPQPSSPSARRPSHLRLVYSAPAPENL